jgi:hypothetical protein
MNFKEISNLSPTSEFKKNYQAFALFKVDMADFLSYESVLQNQLYGLSGQALVIAQNIISNILPKIQQGGDLILQHMHDINASFVGFFSAMSEFCLTCSKNPSSGAPLLPELEKIANSIQQKFSKFSLALDQYHTQINDLITALNTEVNAITQENAVLLSEVQSVRNQINSQTSSVCGVIQASVKALTFQLQSELNSYSAEIAQANAQLRGNYIAIGRMESLVNQVQNNRSFVEQQQNFWTQMQTNLSDLSGDLSGFQSDVSSATIYFVAVQQDWASLTS